MNERSTAPRHLVLYATRHGQTRKIAAHFAAALGRAGIATDLLDVGALPPGFTLARYDGATLAASIYLGKHEREMVRFARLHRAELAKMRTMFMSVSMSQGNAVSAPTPSQRTRALESLARQRKTFEDATGWVPARYESVGGALLYTRYNVFVRWVVRTISRANGGPVDTTRDHEATDWAALDRLVDDVVRARGATVPVGTFRAAVA